jgi:hypothetical protein
MTRDLKILFQDGYQVCMALASFDGNELQSAREVLNVLQKYSDAIKRFQERKPVLRHSLSIKFVTFDEFMHALLNSRKHVVGIETSASRELYHQHFFIDFINNTITLYNGDEERGTMPLNLFYSNWESLFYKDELLVELSAGIKEFEKEDTLPDPPEAIEVEVDGDYVLTPQMMEKLDPEAFDVWNHVMNNTDYAEHPYHKVTIHYSGSGDSGDIDEFRVWTDKENYTSFSDEELYRLVWKLIDTREGGFYNNDGGRGEIVVSPTKFSWDHWNYISDETHDVSEEVDLSEETSEHPF